MDVRQKEISLLCEGQLWAVVLCCAVWDSILINILKDIFNHKKTRSRADKRNLKVDLRSSRPRFELITLLDESINSFETLEVLRDMFSRAHYRR